ncbi:MAG: hypothetical protein ACKVII_21680 [Planctomycetales bacterium]|jgi:hypothetical protein
MMSLFGRSLLTGIAVSLSMLQFSITVTAAPLLESVFPLSCESGKSVTVTLAGKELDKAKSLVFSIPEVTATADDAGKFVVSVAADTPPQDCDVWCVADGHVSNPRRFVVSTLPNIAEAGKNDSSAAAQTIPFPGAVDGLLEAAAKFDWFQFESKEGQSLTLSCRSRSLDGSAQPVVTLFSPAGREIAHSTGRRREPLLHRTLSETGTWRVRVSDRAYKTAADSFYRLELLTGPRFVAAWPDLIQRSQAAQSELAVYGLNLPGKSEWSFPLAGSRFLLQRVVSTIPDPAESMRPAWQSSREIFSTSVSVPVRLHATVGALSGSPRIRFTDRDVAYEDESATQSSTKSQLVAVPVLLNGRFKLRNDVDWFAFEAKKGETFLIDVYGDRLDHLMDVDAVIMDGTGKTLVTFPDKPAPKNLPPILTQASLDVSGSWKAPADGTFHLILRDLYGSTLFGVDRTYALSVRKSQPSFDVVITPPEDKTPAGYSIPQNGRTAVRVSLIRHDGFAVGIRLRLSEENRKAGLILDESWIGPGESSGLAILSSALDGEVTSPIRFLELEATTDADSPLVKHTRAVTLLRAGKADGRFMDRLPVSDSSAQPLTATLSLANTELAPGEKLKLTLKHSLSTGTLKADAKIEFPVLPTGMKAPAAAIKPSTKETTFEIAIPDKLPLGRYSLAAVVSATISKGTEAKPAEVKTPVWSNAVSFHVKPPAKPENPAKENVEPKSE